MAARYPTPWISSRFSNPFVTPSTMFATSVRVRPWRERSGPRSVGRVTVMVSPSCTIDMRAGTCWRSSPFGPCTVTRPGSTRTVTPAGTSIGCLPIRLKSWVLSVGSRLPDETDHFAADSLLLGGAARDDAAGGGEDRGAHPAEHAREAVLAGVDPAAGLGDPLDAGEHALATATVLEVDHEDLVGQVPLLDAVVAHVALLLEDPRDLFLQLGGRQLDDVMQRLVGVADAREHVGDRVGQHLRPPTRSSWSSPGSRPDGRAHADRSGRARISCTRREGGRTCCSGCSCAPCTSRGARPSRSAISSPNPLLTPRFRWSRAEGRGRGAAPLP